MNHNTVARYAQCILTGENCVKHDYALYWPSLNVISAKAINEQCCSLFVVVILEHQTKYNEMLRIERKPDEIFFIVRKSELKDVLSETIKENVKEAFAEAKASSENDPNYEVPIDIHEGAKILGISLTTMYSKISNREFPTFKRGRRVYVLKSDLLNYIKSGKRKSRSDIERDAK